MPREAHGRPLPSERKSARAAQKQAAQPEIAYTVSMERPWTHLLAVEMKLKWTAAPQRVELKMPVWTPGSYLIREYARHVQGFGAKAGANSLAWRKLNKNTWEIDTKGAREVTVTYSVYSNELTVRTNELNDEHAFWNNAALLLFPKGGLGLPSTVTVRPYQNWKVATGLPKVAGAENVFRAPNFDILYDSPFEVSDFNETTFDVAGRPHRIVITGEGNYDLKLLARDITKIAEECRKIFGDMPFDDYTIIVNLRGGGGLEHLNSTALQWNRFGFKPHSRYVDFLNLVAHEYFHLWNVKRIRPDALGPFDYENENYTKLLWVAEGMTSYYEGILLRRAGLITDRAFLDGKASMIGQLQARPGRFETSLEDASLDAWIKYYRQDANSVNNQISYYDKGDLVSMLLDITIRTASSGQRSLDDVLRLLYREYGMKGRNFSPADFEAAAEQVAGRQLDDFFEKYVRGVAELDYDAILNGIGLKLNATEPNRNRAYIGADMTEDGGRLTIRAVPSDTPAYEQGLNVGDQIVAVDGYRASQVFLQSYIGEKKPNERVKLTIFRFDRLREVDFLLGSNLRKSYRIVPVEKPSETQSRLYKDYLNADL
ncbi:MAG: M61 family metallopeptidase [Chloracidobacterium sp.]|nr:M61 family metallopeptidase [Chloracidobacterium sp.]